MKPNQRYTLRSCVLRSIAQAVDSARKLPGVDVAAMHIELLAVMERYIAHDGTAIVPAEDTPT